MKIESIVHDMTTPLFVGGFAMRPWPQRPGENYILVLNIEGYPLKNKQIAYEYEPDQDEIEKQKTKFMLEVVL